MAKTAVVRVLPSPNGCTCQIYANTTTEESRWREVRNDLRQRLSSVVVFAFVGKVAYQRGLERRLVAIGDRILLQHPFVLADVARPQLPRRRQNAAEELRMKRNEVLRREREAAVVDDSRDPLGNLVRLKQFGIRLMPLVLGFVIVVDAPPRLRLGDPSLDVLLGRLDQIPRDGHPVDLLQSNRRRPGLGTRPLPRFLRLEVAAKLAQARIVISHLSQYYTLFRQSE